VEYKYCSNLIIYDTPGFRLGGDEMLTFEIEKMVRDIMRPEHRILICLEQSTVEWANTISRSTIFISSLTIIYFLLDPLLGQLTLILHERF